MPARALICDDAAGYRAMLSAFLVSAGLEVEACNSWHEAIDCAAELQPDVIVVDLWMPTFDPDDLRRVHAASTGSVIVIVSAFDAASSARCVAGIEGISAIVSKRDHPDAIVDAVTGAVAGGVR
jgi:DNA-binding NarL/FixJ family response regulator